MNKQITTNAWLNSQKIVHIKKTYQNIRNTKMNTDTYHLSIRHELYAYPCHHTWLTCPCHCSAFGNCWGHFCFLDYIVKFGSCATAAHLWRFSINLRLQFPFNNNNNNQPLISYRPIRNCKFPGVSQKSLLHILKIAGIESTTVKFSWCDITDTCKSTIDVACTQ